jgi:large subunit ribosomal protein L25
MKKRGYHMEDFTLQVEKRTSTGHKVRLLRSEGWVPAVVYGGADPSQSVQLNAREFDRVLGKGGASNLLNLEGADFPRTRVLIRELQRHPVRRNVLHVDFVRVASGQRITMAVPLHLVGHAPAIELGAVLLQNVDSVEITCLPDDLPQSIEIDVSGLAEVTDRIYARDLKLPQGVVLASDTSDEPLVAMNLSRAAAHADEEEEGAEAPATVEIITERRKED